MTSQYNIYEKKGGVLVEFRNGEQEKAKSKLKHGLKDIFLGLSFSIYAQITLCITN